MAELLSKASAIQQRFFGRDARLLIRPLTILAVILGSFFLGRHVSIRLLVVIVGCIGALIFLRAPMLVIFPLVIGSLFVPFNIDTGTQSSINITMILVVMMLGLWGLDMVVQQRRISLYPARVNWPLIGLCIVATLSFIAGQLPWFAFAHQVSIAAQLAGLMLFWLSAGVFLWVANAITDLKWLRWLVWLYIAGCSLLIIGRALNFTIFNIFYIQEATGSMLWTWFVALTTSQAALNKKLKTSERFVLWFLALAAIFGGWLNRSWASGWVPAVVAFLTIIFFTNWRTGLLLSILIVTIFLVLDPEATKNILASDQYSIFTRQEAWKIVFNEIFQVNPILGLGPANYYNYTALFPILGFLVRFNSHNQYVDVLAQTGIIGLLMYLWLFLEVSVAGWRLRNRAAVGFEKAYVIGVLGGLAGTLVAGMLGDWVIPFIYNIGLAGFRASVFAWAFLGGLVLIERRASQDLDPQIG